MEKLRVVSKRVLYNVMRYAIAATLLLIATECTTVDLRNPWDNYYDPNQGVGKEDIREHFNLHRGRWWNYYARGALYLAYEQYNEAHADFAEAIAKRSRDRYDARTYGMHFIEYFPHRETGVTYYLQGEKETDVSAKEKLLGKAIYELETSLRQEESSRTKFYLNQVRRSLWQVTKQKDTTAPTIHVKKPIYTNQQTVRFDVTVTDQDSHVGDIRIAKSVGDVRIERPRLFVELARKKITKTAELTIGPQEKYAVVTITASDLAGNESNPNSALIIVDTQAPTASVVIVGDRTQPDSPIEVSIEAIDDFGLKQIQVGDDPNNKIECDGAMNYSGTITGMPIGSELPIMVVDNAGNAVITSIPVEDDTGPAQALLSRAPWPQTPRRLPLSNGTGARNWNRPLSPAYLPAMNVLQPRSSMPHYQRGYARTASFAVFQARAAGAVPKFYLLSHVLQLGGKETSQDVFYVDGTLLNAESVAKIAVNVSYKVDEQEKGYKEEIDVSRIISKRQNIVFSQKVDLTDADVDIPITITLEAYCESDSDVAASSCAKKIVGIKKRKDCSLETGAVYGILLLPLRSDSKASALSAEEVSMLSHVYDVVLESLKDLHMSGRDSGKLSKRFNIYDVNEVGSASENTEWYTLEEKDYSIKMSEVIRELQSRQASGETGEPKPSVIDLVIEGNVKLSSTNGEKRFEVMLRAIDVSTTKLIRFPGIGTEDITGVLADVYGRTKDLKWYIDLLAFKVGERFPRLQAKITYIDKDKKIVEIDCGKRNRLFPQIKLWLYDYDGGTDRNADLESLSAGKIINLDWYSCEIRPEKPIRRFSLDNIVITK